MDYADNESSATRAPQRYRINKQNLGQQDVF